MRLPASSPQRNEISGSSSAQRGRAATTFVLAIAFWSGTVWTDAGESYAVSVQVPMQREPGSNAAPVPLAVSNLPAADGAEIALPHHADARFDHAETCQNTNMAALSHLRSPATSNNFLLASIAPTGEHDVRHPTRDTLFSTDGHEMDLVAYNRRKPLQDFAATYRSVQKLAAVLELPRIQNNASQMRATIIGTVSTYNPYRDGLEEGGPQTASGELYDPEAWTAAIQIDLRGQFGGVRYGKLYQPAYALVESGEKQVIVRINDVGRLRPGRVLDLNERSMRYFDPFLTRGLIDGKITLLPGENWTPGPVGDVHMISLASAQ